jgi:hypothetical protein
MSRDEKSGGMRRVAWEEGGGGKGEEEGRGRWRRMVKSRQTNACGRAHEC